MHSQTDDLSPELRTAIARGRVAVYFMFIVLWMNVYLLCMSGEPFAGIAAIFILVGCEVFMALLKRRARGKRPEAVMAMLYTGGPLTAYGLTGATLWCAALLALIIFHAPIAGAILCLSAVLAGLRSIREPFRFLVGQNMLPASVLVIGGLSAAIMALVIITRAFGVFPGERFPLLETLPTVAILGNAVVMFRWLTVRQKRG